MSINFFEDALKKPDKATIESLKKMLGMKLTGSLRSQKKEILKKIKMTSFKYYCGGMQGKRPYMEDRYKIIPLETGLMSFIFDGHGGSTCAEFFNTNFLEYFLKKMRKRKNKPKKSLIETVKEMNKVFLKTKNGSGSTVNVFYIDNLTNKIHNINLGDSRSFAGYKKTYKNISRDHKTDHKREVDFIKKKGGMVKDGRVQGDLAMSRAVGDKDISKYLNDTPAYYCIDMEEDLKFVFHATDGVYDEMSNEEIYKLIMKNKTLTPKQIVQKIIKESYRRGSTDNISASIIFL